MKPVLACALALGLSAAAHAAPVEIDDAALDDLTAAAFIDVTVNVPITVQSDVTVIEHLNVNVLVNIAVAIPTPGSEVKLIQKAIMAATRQ